MFVGLFAIVIGLCFVIIGGLMFKLHKLQAPAIVKQMTARIPVMSGHECVEFRQYNKLTSAELDLHHAELRKYYPTTKKDDRRKNGDDGYDTNRDRDDANAMDLEQDDQDAMFDMQQRMHQD